MRIEHTIPGELMGQKPVRVLVVGAGGTGSAIVMGLPYLDQAMRVWGRSSGLEVVMMDADTVSETNCVRQPFSVSDIGQNKATVLINRINLFWGTRWRAEPANFNERTLDRINDTSLDLLIGCVDTRAARGIIERALRAATTEGITGKRVTPFLLDRIKQLTEGRSLVANIALVKHNAEVGAQIAVALNAL